MTAEERIKELEESLLMCVIAMTSVYPTLETPYDAAHKTALDRARKALAVEKPKCQCAREYR